MKRLTLSSLGFVVGVIGLVGFFASCTNTSTEKTSSQETVTVVVPAPAPMIAPAPAPAPVAAPKPTRPYVPSIIDPPGSGSEHQTVRSPPSTIYVTYGTILTPSDDIRERPYSFVYFPKGPTTQGLKQQYKLICEMYNETFADKQSVSRYLDKKTEKLLPVYWLSRTENPEQPVGCDVMVKEYDYQRAWYLMKMLNRKYTTPNLVAKFGNYVVRMNLDGLEKQEDIDLAFTVWKEHVATYPSREKDLTVVSMVFSARKVLGAFATILTFSKT